MTSDTSVEFRSDRYRRVVRFSLLLLGCLVAAYAISDHPLYGGAPGFGKTQVLIFAGGLALFICGFLPAGYADRILVLAVVGLVMLTIAEWAGEMTLGPRYRATFQLDDRVIFKLIPDRTSVMTRAPINGGITVTQRINTDGFRGPELRPAGEATRIVVYGDSFIHAVYSPWEETFAGQLQELLDARPKQTFEVINAGVSSYGPDQIALKMESELPLLNPDVVIVSIFAGNDFGDLLRNKLFRINDHGVMEPNSNWRLDDQLAMNWELGRRESIIKRALTSSISTIRAQFSEQKQSDGRSAIPDFINLEFLVKQAEREYRDFIVESNDVISNTHIDYYSANLNLTPNSDSARFQSELMRRILTKITDVAEQASVPLVFMFIPHPFDVAENYDEWRIDHDRFPEYDSRNQIRILENTAESLNVPFVSLYDRFRSGDANKLYFHGGDDHWNANGQALAAQMMVNYVSNAELSNTW